MRESDPDCHGRYEIGISIDDYGLFPLVEAAAASLSMPMGLVGVPGFGPSRASLGCQDGTGFPTGVDLADAVPFCTTLLESTTCIWLIDDVAGDARFAADAFLGRLGIVRLAAARILDMEDRPIGLLVLLDTVQDPGRDMPEALLEHAARSIAVRLEKRRVQALLEASRRLQTACRPEVDGSGWVGGLERADHAIAELALRKNESRLTLALDTARLGTWDLDLATRKISLCVRCAQLLDLERPGDVADYRQLELLIHAEDRPGHADKIESCIRDRCDIGSEFRIVLRGGEIRWIRMTGRCVPASDGTPLLLVGLMLDITDDRGLEHRLWHVAHHDELTGLPTRRLMNERLDQALAATRADSGVALLSIDLDRFKTINDALGHSAGDRALRIAADRLRRCARDTDVVARYGGDEFAMLMTDLSGTGQVEACVARIFAAFNEPVSLGGREVVLGSSVGVAIAFDGAVGREQLIVESDLALYRAKAEGRGIHRIYRADTDDAAQDERRIRVSLRQALEREELILFYQPLLSVGSARIVGFEALLRWRHPERGLLEPAAFIDAIEDSELVAPIGRRVLEMACRQAMGWPDVLTVSVNVSATHVARGDLAEDVLAALDKSGLPPGRLELEITERTLLLFAEAQKAALERLQRHGVRVVLDDFGSGYASFAYLRLFRFDKIKIDKSLLIALPDSDGGDAIITAITGLAAALGATTTAEGVETDAQYRLARTCGCTEVQGFLFHRALPPGEIARVLADSMA